VDKNDQKNELIDVAIKWVEKKDINYLAKEGLLVYYTSLTGRKYDLRWHKLSLTEAVRIITATQMSADSASTLKPEHLIMACQELSRVYEHGVSSRYPVTDEVFNYLARADIDLSAQAMSLLARELLSEGYMAFKINDLIEIYRGLNERLDLGTGSGAINDLIWAHFPPLGYEVRIQQYRVVINSKKVGVVMMPGRKPKHVIDISDEMKLSIIRKLFSQLR